MSEFLLRNISPKKNVFSPIEIVTKENFEFVNIYKQEFEEFYYSK